jgi:hypothetical protein
MTFSKRYGSWYRFVDSLVEKVSLDQVLSSNPRMLLYEKVTTG